MSIRLSHTFPFKGFRLVFDYNYIPGVLGFNDELEESPEIETTSVWLELPLGDATKGEWHPVVDLLACGFLNEFLNILPRLEHNLLDLPQPDLEDFANSLDWPGSIFPFSASGDAT